MSEQVSGCAWGVAGQAAGSGGANPAGGNAQGGKSGAGVTSGSGGTSDSAGAAGEPIAEAGMGGAPIEVGGAPDVLGGEGGMSGASGAPGEAGAGGAPVVVDPCIGAVVGGVSKLPLPATTGVAKPTGALGNLKVLNWAGFQGALSFTFDDALASQINHYAELNAVGVPMTFYLVGQNDGSKPAWTKAAQDGHELGNHTMHHCNADGTGCGWGTFSNIDSELDDCTAHLKSAFGVEGVYSFASPMGDSNWVLPASSRFLVGRGVYDNPAGVVPNDSTNPFNLPCHISDQGETAAAVAPAHGFNQVTDSVRTNGSWRIILNHALLTQSTDSGDGYHPVLASEVVAAMTYARDVGGVWVDTVTHIGAYWRAQKAVSAVQATTSGTSRVYSWKLPAHFPPGQFLRVTVNGGSVQQCGTALSWNDHGYYEIALDAGSLTVSP